MNRISRNINKNKVQCVLPSLKPQIKIKVKNFGRKTANGKIIYSYYLDLSKHKRIGIKIDNHLLKMDEEDSDADVSLQKLNAKYQNLIDAEMVMFDALG